MGYKPFAMEDPKLGRWNDNVIGPRKVEPRAPSPPAHPGTHMKAKVNGVYGLPRLRIACAPEQLVRRQPSERQLNASYCRFLEEKGWKPRRISEFLNLKLSFVNSVLLMYTYKGRGPLRPPNFEDADK